MSAIAVVEEAAAKLGGIRKLARELGIKHNSLYRWTKVPAERVLQFEKLSGKSRHELRPDIYGPPRKRKSEQHAV
jgi:DNA-binding transcriptional regulator YdaS (Cro superfamily)